MAPHQPQDTGFAFVAVDGRDAVKIFQDRCDEICCVLLDLSMPGMNGDEAYREIWFHDPKVKAILCSGHAEHGFMEKFAGLGLAGSLQKSFDIATLRAKLSEALAGSDALEFE